MVHGQECSYTFQLGTFFVQNGFVCVSLSLCLSLSIYIYKNKVQEFKPPNHCNWPGCAVPIFNWASQYVTGLFGY